MESRRYQGGIRLPDGRGRIYWRLPIALLAVLLTVGSPARRSPKQSSRTKLFNKVSPPRTPVASPRPRPTTVRFSSMTRTTSTPTSTSGLIDQTNGALASAESNYRLALSIDPQFVSALFNLAIVRHDLGDLKESIALYRQAIKVQPDYANAHLNLGFALIEAHQDVEGNAELKIAVQLDPSLASRVKGVKVEPSPAASESPSASPS